MYTVYILYSTRYDRYYIGQTNNLLIRLAQHNEGKSISTKHYRPWALVYREEYSNRGLAMGKEKYLKSLKSKKQLVKYIAGWRSSTSRGP